MSVQIRHVLPPNSFRFEDKNLLRKMAAIFKNWVNNFSRKRWRAQGSPFAPGMPAGAIRRLRAGDPVTMG
jgi:hypothetical protein